MPKLLHHSCTVMRRKLVKHSTVNLATGVRTEGREEWVTEPCGVPLFNEKEQQTGECRSCASGWTHPNNYRVDLTKRFLVVDTKVQPGEQCPRLASFDTEDEASTFIGTLPEADTGRYGLDDMEEN